MKNVLPPSCFYNDELKAAILKQHNFNDKDLKFQQDLKKRLKNLESKFGNEENKSKKIKGMSEK